MSIKATPTPAKALLDPSNHALVLIVRRQRQWHRFEVVI